MIPSAPARLWFMGLGSVVFFAWLEPHGTLLLFVLSVWVYARSARLRAGDKRVKVFEMILIPLFFLLALKYILPVFIRHSAWNVPEILVPLGISFHTLKQIHYAVESGRGKFEEHTFRDYLAYLFFLPMFPAGPIERFDRFFTQTRSFTWALASRGLERILMGSAKKFLLADFLLRALLPDPLLFEGGAPGLHFSAVLFASWIQFLIFYFTWSGYSDIAIGGGNLFGLRLMENFNQPLRARNLSGFWDSWHISLTSWARDYVYLPLSNRIQKQGALIVMMAVIGLWHGPRLGWFFWGLHHAAGLIFLQRYHPLQKAPAWVSRLAVWVYLALGFSLIIDPTDQGRLYLKIVTLGWVS